MEVSLLSTNLVFPLTAPSLAHQTQFLQLAELLPPEAKQSPSHISTSGYCAVFHNAGTVWVMDTQKSRCTKLDTKSQIQNSRVSPRGTHIACLGTFFPPMTIKATYSTSPLPHTKKTKDVTGLSLWNVISKQKLKTYSLSSSSQKIVIMQFNSVDKLSFITSSNECFEWNVDKTTKPRLVQKDEKDEIGEPHPSPFCFS